MCPSRLIEIDSAPTGSKDYRTALGQSAKDMTLSRRSLIALTIIGAAVACVTPLKSRRTLKLMPNELTQVFSRYRAYARRVGQRYIDCTQPVGSLTDVLSSLNLPSVPANSGTDSIGTLLTDRIQQDFREGRTVQVDGWILSETEAKLCALVAMNG